MQLSIFTQVLYNFELLDYFYFLLLHTLILLLFQIVFIPFLSNENHGSSNVFIMNLCDKHMLVFYLVRKIVRICLFNVV